MRKLKESVAYQKSMQKEDYELLFCDSPSPFVVLNAKMIQEGAFVRFMCYDEMDNPIGNIYYPISNIYRIKTFAD